MQSCQLCLLQLKCVLFNFIVMYPSDKRSCLYASGAAKKREGRGGEGRGGEGRGGEGRGGEGRGGEE